MGSEMCIRDSLSAWHSQPRHGRAPAEQGLGETELAPASDQAVVPHADPASLTRRPGQEVTEVRVGEERGHRPPAAMTNGVHQVKELEATGLSHG